MTYSTTIDQTIENFDQTAFIKNTATYFAVSDESISIKINGGSIEVETTIQTTTKGLVTAMADKVNAASLSDLENALGVPVTQKTTAEVDTVVINPDFGDYDGLSDGEIAGIVIGVIAFVAILAAGAAFVLLNKRRVVLKMPTTMVEP